MPSETPMPPDGYESWLDAVLIATREHEGGWQYAKHELSALREQVKRLEKFVDHQDLHSDFRNASEMRAEIERLRGRVIQARNAALDEAAAAAWNAIGDYMRDGSWHDAQELASNAIDELKGP